MAYPYSNVAANVSTLDMSISAYAEAWSGGKRVTQDKVSANYLITFRGRYENSTYYYVPAVYCKDFYAE